MQTNSACQSVSLQPTGDKVKWSLSYVLCRLLGGVVATMPIRVLDAAASLLAVLTFDVLRLRRVLVLQNLATAFPEKSVAERIRIGRSSYYHFLASGLEVLRSQRCDITLDCEVESQGAKFIRDALSQGKGVYGLVGHLGNWEALGAIITHQICPAHVIVKHLGMAGFDRYVNEIRAKNGFLVIDRKAKGDGAKGILATLQRKEVVGFVIDQARPGSPALPFFGRPAKTNISLAVLALRWRAPILPVYAKRVSFAKHQVVWLPELEVIVTGNGDQDALTLSASFNLAMEEMIRANPEQYFWLHRRWKG